MSDSADPVLLRIMLSGDDYARAEEFVKAARLHAVGNIEYEALMHSAILFYARPYSDNEPKKSKLPDAARKLTGLDLPEILGDDLPFHERLIALRNKVIAHAESEFFPAQNIKLAIGSKGQSGIAFQRRSWHVVSENLDLEIFERVATKMRAAARKHVLDRTRRQLGRSRPRDFDSGAPPRCIQNRIRTTQCHSEFLFTEIHKFSRE
jgi:hypothetical protein